MWPHVGSTFKHSRRRPNIWQHQKNGATRSLEVGFPLKKRVDCTTVDSDYKQRWVEKLARLRKGLELGVVVGVEISKPKPWPPAARILELHSEGLEVGSIAKKVGYSKYTVERAIKTRGEDPRTGEQCSRYAGRIFSVEEALKKMPLPCGPECVCDWRPILRSDKRRE